MIPIRDVIPTRTAPAVTLVLIAISVAGWIAARLHADDTYRLILTHGLMPAHFSWAAALTSLFLPTSAVTVVANAVGLWICGSTLEDRLGHGRFVVFYVLTGLAGLAIAAATAPASTTPIVGAGAAVAGIMGGYLALFRHSQVLLLVPAWRDLDLIEVPAAVLPAVWLLVQMLDGGEFDPLTTGAVLPAWASVAGAAAGAATVWIARVPSRQRVEWWGA